MVPDATLVLWFILLALVLPHTGTAEAVAAACAMPARSAVHQETPSSGSQLPAGTTATVLTSSGRCWVACRTLLQHYVLRNYTAAVDAAIAAKLLNE
jgi:hypothetical protein